MKFLFLCAHLHTSSTCPLATMLLYICSFLWILSIVCFHFAAVPICNTTGRNKWCIGASEVCFCAFLFYFSTEKNGMQSWLVISILLTDKYINFTAVCTYCYSFKEVCPYIIYLTFFPLIFSLFFEGSLISLPEKKLCICIQPQPQNLTVGDALVLECGAVGNPIPQYQWFRNGFPLANGNKNVYTVSYRTVQFLGD